MDVPLYERPRLRDESGAGHFLEVELCKEAIRIQDGVSTLSECGEGSSSVHISGSLRASNV